MRLTQTSLKVISEKGNPDYLFLGLVIVLVVFGLVMLSSASVVAGFQKFGDSYYYLKHQLYSGLLPGILLFLVASRINYRVWERLAFPFFLITVALLVSVFIPHLAFSYGGAYRWVSLGPLLFQPAEIAKLTIVIYLAAWLSKKKHELSDFSYGFVPFVILIGVVSILILLQPDFGTLAVILGSSVAVYIVAGGRSKHIGGLILGLLAVGLLLIQVAPYRLSRLQVFLNPALEPQGAGYHVTQAILGIGSGGIFGSGLGSSRQKENFLPEPSGDSIFAIIGEELGFVAAAGFILLVIAFALRGFKIASKAPDDFGAMLSVGIMSWLTLQSLINIGAMIGILPLTGIPLPFVSYGGTALATSLGAVGIIYNISRTRHTRSGS